MASRGWETGNNGTKNSHGVPNSMPHLIDFGNDDEMCGFGSSKTGQTPTAPNSIEFSWLDQKNSRAEEDILENLFDYDTLNLKSQANRTFHKPLSSSSSGAVVSSQSTVDLLSDISSSTSVLDLKPKTSASAAYGVNDTVFHQDDPFATCFSDSLSSGYTNPFESPSFDSEANNPFTTALEPQLDFANPFTKQSCPGIGNLSISQEDPYPSWGSSIKILGNRVSPTRKSLEHPEYNASQKVGSEGGYEDQADSGDLKLRNKTEVEDYPFRLKGTNANAGFSKGDIHHKQRNKVSVNVSAPSLDEFVASGGGKGIFRVPVREAIRPGRPAFLELRPHPLRETQDGQAVCTIICTGSRLWAGLESEIRFWDIDKAYRIGKQSNPLLGDEDTAPFLSFHLQDSPTICFVVDAARNMVWSGHRDGNIRGWPTDASSDAVSPKLTWRAHPGPVLSMVITSYGELWAGSEVGSIRAWSWEVFEKALSNDAENYRNVVYLLEGCYIDLRSRLTTINASILGTDIRFLISDHSNDRIWSGGSYSLALWDSQTRDVLKVFGLDAQVEFLNPVLLPGQDIQFESEMRVNFNKVPKKEKIQGTLNFLQRSKNALLGAADAVCRATIGGQLLDDGRRIQAMVAAVDGTVWTGYANGLVVHWGHHGNQLNEFQNTSVGVHCLRVCGRSLWIGYADGRIQVIEQNGKMVKGWLAHSSTVLQMAVGSGHVFTLAANGGIRGWNMEILSPVENILRSKLIDMEPAYTRKEHIKVLAGTWNVSQGRASFDSLKWLASPASEANIVVVGLQEIEMGAGVLAMAAAKETVGIEGSANGQMWLDCIGDVIDEGRLFVRVGSRQLAGLLIGAWVRRDLLPYAGDIDVGAVACGFGRAFGNKGAVAIKMRVFRRTICIINSHFAAHMDAVARRNADFDYVFRSMTFSRVAANSVTGVSSAVQMFRGVSARRFPQHFEIGGHENESPSLSPTGMAPQEVMPELAQADMIIWLGDFNYRLNDISYEDAINCIKQKDLETLLRRDQLREEMQAGRVFQGMREGQINFLPTYKFDRGQQGPEGYDSSEKRRVPAWCDRILFRDSRSGKSTKCTLLCPIVSSIECYDTCLDITESDHKPVMAMFNLDIAFIDEGARREKYGHLIRTINAQYDQDLSFYK